MDTLAFVPRSIKRRKVAPPSTSVTTPDQPSESRTEATSSVTAASQIASASSTPNPIPTQKNNQTAKQSPLPLDLAILVWLALSDYALWGNADLRRKIDFGSDERSSGEDMDSKISKDNIGYVQLNYLFERSPVFRLASASPAYSDPKELAYVSALRNHAKDDVDVRFIVDSEPSSTRAAMESSRKKAPKSLYEVRRKDFASLKESELSRYSKADWDGLTVYMENIPAKSRTLLEITKLATSLLPLSSDPSTFPRRVQNISLPPHHMDKPDSIQTCKGFALVTLSAQEDVRALLDAFPWDKTTRPTGSSAPTNPAHSQKSSSTLAGQNSGLRICTKKHWEELRTEYMAYRQQLVDEITRHQDSEEALRRVKQGGKSQAADHLDTSGNARVEQAPWESGAPGSKRKRDVVENGDYLDVIHAGSNYPAGCLVFVRNVNPGTNKTTLKTLFGRAWETDSKDGKHGAEYIDYVDYSKNMDSCYVRLSTPTQAERFVEFFSNHPVLQTSGLDGQGSQVESNASNTSSLKLIQLELVSGKRQELYWEKIPENVKRQAVEKTLKALQKEASRDGPSESLENGGEGNEDVDVSNTGDEGEPKRKKRRKGKRRGRGGEKANVVARD